MLTGRRSRRRDDRVFHDDLLAGFVARDKEWTSLSRRWKNRCLRDGIQFDHAADCEGAFGQFKHLSKSQIVELNRDLITEILNTRIVGWGTSLVLEDYHALLDSSERARNMFGTSPYFLVMQTLLVTVCGEIRDDRPNYRAAFVFDQQEEFSGRAKQMYDQVRQKNPNIAPCMGTLTYADKERFTPLQVADKLAYEIMKDLLNRRYDPTRKERVALARMKEGKVIQTINYLDRDSLRMILDSQAEGVFESP